MGPAQAAEVTRVFRVVSQPGVASAYFGQEEMGVVHSSAFLLVVGLVGADAARERSEVDLNQST